MHRHRQVRGGLSSQAGLGAREGLWDLLGDLGAEAIEGVDVLRRPGREPLLLQGVHPTNASSLDSPDSVGCIVAKTISKIHLASEIMISEKVNF